MNNFLILARIFMIIMGMKTFLSQKINKIRMELI